MALSERRFKELTRQLMLWERTDPEGLDRPVLERNFSDAVKVLGEFVDNASGIGASVYVFCVGLSVGIAATWLFMRR